MKWCSRSPPVQNTLWCIQDNIHQRKNHEDVSATIRCHDFLFVKVIMFILSVVHPHLDKVCRWCKFPFIYRNLNRIKDLWGFGTWDICCRSDQQTLARVLLRFRIDFLCCAVKLFDHHDIKTDFHLVQTLMIFTLSQLMWHFLAGIFRFFFPSHCFSLISPFSCSPQGMGGAPLCGPSHKETPISLQTLNGS